MENTNLFIASTILESLIYVFIIACLILNMQKKNSISHFVKLAVIASIICVFAAVSTIINVKLGLNYIHNIIEIFIFIRIAKYNIIIARSLLRLKKELKSIMVMFENIINSENE